MTDGSKMIYLIESNKNPFGHSLVYLNSLLKINGTVHLDKDVNLCKKHRFDSTVWRCYVALREQLNAVPKGSIAHILFVDYYYKVFFAGYLLKRNKTIVTLHNFPNKRWRRVLLKIFCRNVFQVIVHSDYIRDQLINIGVRNVTYIDYPSFYDYESVGTRTEIRNKYHISDDTVVLSSIGAIRPDKGLDILLESFKYIKPEVKEHLLLNVAGLSYGYFMSEQKIISLCNESDIANRLTIRGLTETEFMENVLLSDCLVMPYRKEMTGNSGPMTEAIVNHVPCIVPTDSNIGDIAVKHHVGVTFESENPQSLAKVIEQLFENNNTHFDFSYAEQLKENVFLSKYAVLYFTK